MHPIGVFAEVRMSLTHHEFWALVHGMGLGGLYLVLFSAGLAALAAMRPGVLTDAGLEIRRRWLPVWFWLSAGLLWLTNIVGTLVVYPWYRDAGPDSPRSDLLADPSTAGWHAVGMEWKEHIGWQAAILATAAAVVVSRCRDGLVRRPLLRRTAMTLYALAFLAATVAAVFGALITKIAPVMGR